MNVGIIDVVTMVAAASAATAAYALWPRTLYRSPRLRPDTSDVAAGPPPPAVQVGVLGPVEVHRHGTRVSLPPRALELVVYLATHPTGVTEDQLRCALWPDQPITSGSLRNLLWRTRRQLGTVEGEPALALAGSDGRYRLHPEVTCDLASLDTGADDSEAASRLILDVVRGRPFEVPGGFGWAWREGLVGWAEQRIADAAHRVAEHHLDCGRHAAAAAAAERGLLGAPGDETLFRDRMLANAAAGNRAAVERVMAELLAVLEIASPEELHPETLTVYRRHGRGTALSRAAMSSS